MGGPRGKDQLVGVRGIKMPLYFSPCGFIGIGRLLAQGMHPAVDVGINPRVIVYNGVDDALWSLRSRCVVKINQGLTIDFPL